MNDMATNPTADIQNKILEAAEERFRHYGYRKTTMAEIASDVDMSAANLYRYFSNKEDIGAACVIRCFQESEEVLRDVLKRKDLSAEQKLLEFILSKLDYVYDETKNNPKINELIDMFIHEQQELLFKQKSGIQALVAEILAEGNRSGEFSVKDIVKESESIVNATVLFQVPIFMPLFPKEQFKELASNVVMLLIKGLRP